jgi:hypothetical protein
MIWPISAAERRDIVPGGFGVGCALANSFRIADDIKPCSGESGLITDIAAAALRFAGEYPKQSSLQPVMSGKGLPDGPWINFFLVVIRARLLFGSG